MSKNVQIELIGSQLFEGDSQSQITPAKCTGTYYSREGFEFLLYYQKSDNDETRSLIKFKENYLELTEKGAYTTHLVFEPGKEFTSNYHTPYGVMTVCVFTKALKIVRVAGLTEINISYKMALNDESTAECELKINIKDDN